MQHPAATAVIDRRYRESFAATVQPSFRDYVGYSRTSGSIAALGFRRASGGALFLESYLDQPVEALVAQALARPCDRSAIVEIGNFAADNAVVMLDLWGKVANDLGGACEIAVATLTAPLRRMFQRIGIPIQIIAPALQQRLGADGASWGSYFAQDPQVCVGVIADGQQALAIWLQRRRTGNAA